MNNKPLNKILYLEDDEDIQVIVEIALCQVGKFQLKTCDTLSCARSKLTQFQPDLLLLDVMMPGVNGVECLKTLRQVQGFGEIPAIFLTAKVQQADIERLIAAGALGVIAKPFDPMTLASQIESYWQ